MRTTEERIKVLHQRADRLKKERDKSVLRALGGLSGGLSVCMVALLVFFGKTGHDITGSGYAATSLLSGTVGGYVLVAVIAFFVGSVISVFIHKRMKN